MNSAFNELMGENLEDLIYDAEGDMDDETESPQRLYVREFLNKPGYLSSAHIIAEVSDSSAETKPDGTPNFSTGWCGLTIGDCQRQISLSLGLHTADERSNTRFKLDLLVDTLIRFREAVFAEADLADEREPKRLAQRRERRRARRAGGMDVLAGRSLTTPDGQRYIYEKVADDGDIILIPENPDA